MMHGYAVNCDNCEVWVHNECSYISEIQYETLQNSNFTCIRHKPGLFIDAFIVSGVCVFGLCFVILYFHLRFTINGMILILK